MADSYRIAARRRKVIELNNKGFTIPEIVQMLSRDHNIKASERTIWGDLHSELALNGFTEFNAEQIRKLNNDLEKADLSLRIKGRIALIRATAPRRQLIKEELNETLTVKTKEGELDLDGLSDLQREEIRRVARLMEGRVKKSS